MARNQGDLLGYARRAQRVSTLRKFVWGLLIFLPISGVAAASIVINSGSTVEFGQGSADVVACDDAFNVEPITEFVNDEFKLDYVQVSDIDTTGCANQVLLVSVYASGNPTAIAQVSRAVSATSLDFDFSTFSPRIDTSNIGSVTVEQAGRAGLVPSLSAVTSEIEAFNFTITNYDATYSWSLSATTGTASLNTNTGVVSVTGLTSGQSSTVTVTTTRSGYSSESASVTGSARVVLTFATAANILNPNDYYDPSNGWSVGMAGDATRAMVASWTRPSFDTGIFILERSGTNWSVVDSDPNSVQSRIVPSDYTSTAVTSYSITNNVVTINTATAHGFTVGQSIEFSGDNPPFHTAETVTAVPTSTSFQYSETAANVSTTALNVRVARASKLGFQDSIAMSETGTRIVVGDEEVPVPGKGKGKVYIFDLVAGSWIETVISNPTSTNGFGRSVDISADGRTIYIGHTQTNGFGSWIYYYNDSNIWEKQSNAANTGATSPTLKGSSLGSTAHFGLVASLSSNGDTIAVSSYAENSYYGAIYIFTRSAGVWSEQARLTASDFATYQSAAIQQQFGGALGLSPDGNTVGIGARGDWRQRGAVYIFTRSGTNWSQVQKINNPDNDDNDFFGSGVMLTSNAEDLFIGVDGFDANRNSQGAVYHYFKNGSTWTLNSRIEPLNPPFSSYVGGRSNQLAISNDGTWLITGNGSAAGRVKPFIMIINGQ